MCLWDPPSSTSTFLCNAAVENNVKYAAYNLIQHIPWIYKSPLGLFHTKLQLWFSCFSLFANNSKWESFLGRRNPTTLVSRVLPAFWTPVTQKLIHKASPHFVRPEVLTVEDQPLHSALCYQQALRSQAPQPERDCGCHCSRQERLPPLTSTEYRRVARSLIFCCRSQLCLLLHKWAFSLWNAQK